MNIGFVGGERENSAMSKDTFSSFRKNAQSGNLIPLVQTLKADTETPVSLFLKMAGKPCRFILEPSDLNGKQGRFSYLGCEPPLVLAHDKATGLRARRIPPPISWPPTVFYRQWIRQIHPVRTPDLPDWAGGWVGFNQGGESFFVFQDSVISFDNLKFEIKLSVMCSVDGSESLRKVFDRESRRLDSLAALINKTLSRSDRFKKVVSEGAPSSMGSGRDFIQLNANPDKSFRAFRWCRKGRPENFHFYIENEGKAHGFSFMGDRVRWNALSASSETFSEPSLSSSHRFGVFDFFGNCELVSVDGAGTKLPTHSVVENSKENTAQSTPAVAVRIEGVDPS